MSKRIYEASVVGGQAVKMAAGAAGVIRQDLNAQWRLVVPDEAGGMWRAARRASEAARAGDKRGGSVVSGGSGGSSTGSGQKRQYSTSGGSPLARSLVSLWRSGPCYIRSSTELRLRSFSTAEKSSASYDGKSSLPEGLEQRKKGPKTTASKHSKRSIVTKPSDSILDSTKAVSETNTPPSSSSSSFRAADDSSQNSNDSQEPKINPHNLEQLTLDNTGVVAPKRRKVKLSQSEVPSGRLSRIFHYGSLAAGMGLGAAQHGLRKMASGESDSLSLKSMLLSPQNIKRMASKLSQMRGAALKVGQLMSFQDSLLFPKEIQQILLSVQNLAHYMPKGQLEQVMCQDLGEGWRGRLFALFDDVPIAAASIGQVHTAVTEDLSPVVVKVQYPGVANSIDSDLSNILLLLTASLLLPKGLFLDKTIANARVELKWECDYIREAQALIRFREMIGDDPCFTVPRVHSSLCGQHVLTMERMRGIEVVQGQWNQETRDWIATQIMRLCLLEIGKFQFMQTDPNWANFLYNQETHRIELLDFGAARDFSDEFIADYKQVLRALIRKDRDGVEHYLRRLGYLTGHELAAMKNAHIDSVLVLGEVFSPLDNHGKAFSFRNQTVTERVRGNIKLMLDERLTPPPEETYLLHRKLSGVYLLCARLEATVPCQQLFEEIIGMDE